MINIRDVIRMKIPYPTIRDKLAVTAHMYICQSKNGSDHQFVKCQTLKPYMIYNNTMRHYLDEKPDIERNPFTRTTRIDCDKVFGTNGVMYSDAMKTTLRPDVSQDVFLALERELVSDGYEKFSLSEDDIRKLNPLVK